MAGNLAILRAQVELALAGRVAAPFTIRDRREFFYHLEPARIPSAMDLLNKGQELRNRGQQLMPLPGITRRTSARDMPSRTGPTPT